MRISRSNHGDRTWLVCLVAFGMCALNLNACTLWGVVYTNAPGGTILSQNRDWKPDHTQVLKMNRSGKGYAYFGLYAVGGAEPGIKEGVNEKGLTVVTASASSIPPRQSLVEVLLIRITFSTRNSRRSTRRSESAVPCAWNGSRSC